MKKILAMALAGALFTPAFAEAESLRLLAAAEGDLVVKQLSAQKSALSKDIEREPVDFAWALDPAQPLSRETPFVADSREFWTALDADTLQKGYRFQTTAPGALIRISPTGGHSKSGLQVADLSLRINGQSISAERGIAAMADATQLKAAGVDFSEGSVVFQLAPEIGVGSIELSSTKAAGGYLLHVYEPESPVSLMLSADKDRAVAGGQVTLLAQWQGETKTMRPQSIGAVVTSPTGHSQTIDFIRNKQGGYEAIIALPADAATGMALWEVHTFASAQTKAGALNRDAKTSFSVSLPTARLTGEAEVLRTPSSGFAVTLPVEVASAGRYEVRGVLYGTASNGDLQPFGIAHSARWLSPGTGTLSLDFADLAARAGMRAPFELRDLQLNDQARMGMLETRARALQIGALPDQAKR